MFESLFYLSCLALLLATVRDVVTRNREERTVIDALQLWSPSRVVVFALFLLLAFLNYG